MSGQANLNIVGSIDHLPAFSIDPPGTLVLRSHWDENDHWLTIVKADPHVEFTDTLLEKVFNNVDFQGDAQVWYPGMWIDLTTINCREGHGWDACPAAPGICYLDGFVHIEARDRHVIYRITGYNEDRKTWVASWPD